MLAAVFLLLASSSFAAVLGETPRVPGAAAPVAAVAPALVAPLSLNASPAPALAAPLVERRGRDSFGREVIVLDALHPAEPARGTVGHVDFSVGSGQAQLNGPLDTWTSPRAEGAPDGADLSHFREHLWFGLAVAPEHRGSGLGARLMGAAAGSMRAAGARVLFIRATESSLGFYKKFFGAAIRGIEKEPLDDGDCLYRVEVDLTAVP